MSRALAFYLPATLFFLLADAIWLYTVGESFLKPRLAHLMREEVDVKVAALFYLFFGVALVVFAILPAIDAGGWQRAALLGALLGFTAYGAYDFTNMATLRGYSWSYVLVDMAWGTALSAAAASVGYLAGRWYLGPA